MSSSGNFIHENREKLKLVAYFVVMVAVVSPLFTTIGTAWKRAWLFRGIINSISVLMGFELSVGMKRFTALGFGFFLGLMVLITLDHKKRWQGVLLWVGLVVALVALRSLGLMDFSFLSYAPSLLLGIALGVVVGGGDTLAQNQNAREFRRAALLVFYLLTAVVALGIVEFHVQYPKLLRFPGGTSIAVNTPRRFAVSFKDDKILQNLLLGGIFVTTLNRFVEYDAELRLFVLGPRESGKSLFLVGAYKAALEEIVTKHQETSVEANSALMENVGALENASRDAGWEIGATGAQETTDLHFNFVKGSVFPKNIELRGMDYAGEYLERLPDALMGGEVDDPTLMRLANRVQDAETLILLIDCEKFMNNESMGIEPYFDIVQSLGDDKEFLLVATKADLLSDQFYEEKNRDAMNYPDEFREFVNEKLQQKTQIITLLQDTGAAQIHPVFYQTKVNDEGERVPLRDESGNMITYGFEDLLENMG